MAGPERGDLRHAVRGQSAHRALADTTTALHKSPPAAGLGFGDVEFRDRRERLRGGARISCRRDLTEAPSHMKHESQRTETTQLISSQTLIKNLPN